MRGIDVYFDLSKPPADVLKRIEGGRLKNFTDIKPQWRIKKMTGIFGLCGTGWDYDIEKLWSKPGANGEIICFAMVSLRYKNDDQWSEWIPGVGGSKLVEKEKEGLHTNDEGYKMAITDALSSAMKMIGMAAEIYMGNWDGSKYKDEIKEDIPKAILLSTILNKIKNAKNEEELRMIYNEAYGNFPNNLGDIVSAKNERKKELGL